MSDFLRRIYPEFDAGGYHHANGRVAFFTRLASILPKEAHVLDFGAGRGRFSYGESEGARVHTDLTGRVARFAAFDVDPVVLENPDTEDRHHAKIGAPLPFQDNSFDIIFSWMVFEHIADPAFYAAELDRILRPGGWICAGTPNKWGLTGMITRAVPNKMHVGVLRKLAPQRKEEDVFPTTYRLNTRQTIRRFFAPEDYQDCSYFMTTGAAYHGNKMLLARLWMFYNWLMPPSLRPQFHIFLRKKRTNQPSAEKT